MRPIDYAIKLMAAHTMSNELFCDLADSLYYEDNAFISAVRNCLEEHDSDTLCAVEDVFHQIDCQL